MAAAESAHGTQNTVNTRLQFDLFVTPSIEVVAPDMAPGEHERPWPPISSTLIHGLRDAVLVGGGCGEILGTAFPRSASEASYGGRRTHDQCDRIRRRKADCDSVGVHG